MYIWGQRVADARGSRMPSAPEMESDFVVAVGLLASLEVEVASVNLRARLPARVFYVTGAPWNSRAGFLDVGYT